MPGVLYNADNVVVGEAYLYLAPWVKGAVKALVPDVTAIFAVAVWETAGWQVAGATHEGFKINVETSTTTITIEESSVPVGERVESKGITIEAALAEDTVETMKLSWGGGTITTAAAASGVPGSKKMFLSDDIAYFTVALEMRNSFGLARRIYIPKASVTGSGETSFRRSADKRTYPLRVASISPASQIQIVELTAAALP